MEFKKLSTAKKNGKNSHEFIMLHHTAMGGDKDGKSAARYLSGPQSQGGKVSVHYVVGQDGTVWKIGEHTDRLWHAGNPTNYLGITDFNNCSIGIEIDSNGYIYSDAQIKATNELVVYLCKELNIGTDKIIRHAEITKTKWDVGPNFFLNQGVKDLLDYRTKIESILISNFMGEYEKKFGELYPNGSTVYTDLPGAANKIKTFRELTYWAAIGFERVKSGK